MVASISASSMAAALLSGAGSKGGSAEGQIASVKAEIASAKSELQCTECEDDQASLEQQIKQLETKLRRLQAQGTASTGEAGQADKADKADKADDVAASGGSERGGMKGPLADKSGEARLGPTPRPGEPGYVIDISA